MLDSNTQIIKIVYDKSELLRDMFINVCRYFHQNPKEFEKATFLDDKMKSQIQNILDIWNNNPNAILI